MYREQELNIAVFYPKTPFAAWSICGGIVDTLKRMGHTVIDAPTPPNPNRDSIPVHLIERIKADLPTIEALNKCDLIIVSGPEHIACWIDCCYGVYEWKNAVTTVKAGMYHESQNRSDGGEIDFTQVGWVSNFHFFPAAQDAEFFDQEHLYKDRCWWSPFAVDTSIFKPHCYGLNLTIDDVITGKGGTINSGPSDKKYDTLFLGSIYGLRAKWLEQLGQFNHPPIKIGRCHYEDANGADIRKIAEMMAEDIRRAKVFFNLPPLSMLDVTKVMEVMACGTFLLTPEMPTLHRAHLNNVLFTDKVHLERYDPRLKAQVARRLNEWQKPENEAEREKIARAGCEEVHAKHSLEVRLTWLLDKCGLKVQTQ